MLELDFSVGDLDGFIDAVIDEFQEPFEVGGQLLQFGNFLRFSMGHQGCLKVARKQISDSFRLA
jgi:hypothetical protein